MKVKSRFGILSIIVLGIFTIAQCDFDVNRELADGVAYLNHGDSVEYVGIETCKQCHYDKYESFIRTGMGSSFGVADTSKSIAKLSDKSWIYDPHLNFYYHPSWIGDSLFVNELRLKGTDTTFSLQKRMDYVVGSGQHTNSHIFNENDYLYQAPFTWYAQKGTLDLPPGYENGGNERFDRLIGLECMSCHNAMPTKFVKGSINKFKIIPKGIDCERCHGPGGAHVRKIQRGDLTDTANFIDYSIVNPGKLSAELQFEICQRCHLQGNVVLAEERSFFDFKPGMKLNKVMDVYLPRFDNSGDRFIMASHVDRFKESKCFKQSGNYTCISCHDPHLSVRETNTAKFNLTCINCHKQNNEALCSADEEQIKQNNNNCVVCHMPASGSIDIPHVSVHDHFVRKNYEASDSVENGEFLQLVAINNENPTFRSKAIAYMQQYERFNKEKFLLDSARFYLQKADAKKESINLWVHYHYLKKEFLHIERIINKVGVGEVLEKLNKVSYSNTDAWTAYRIGEAMSSLKETKAALMFFMKSVELAPYITDFRNKYGTSLLKEKRLTEASIQFENLLKENPSHKEGLNNLGYCNLLKGNYEEAIDLFKKATRQDPDYLLPWLNLATIYAQEADSFKLLKCLDKILTIDPDHQQALRLKSQIN